MRNATINHRTACTHAQTPKARKECRKAARKAEAAAQVPAAKTYNAVILGRGAAIHLAVLSEDRMHYYGTECGSGLYRGVRRAPEPQVLAQQVTAEHITCTKCAKKV